MRGLLILIGHLILMLIGSYFGFGERRSIQTGDGQTAYVGVFFIYWASVIIYASISESRDWLLRFLGRSTTAFPLGLVFLILGVVLLVVGLLPK